MNWPWYRKPASRSKLEAFREGHLTPVYFGSALRNFGVGDLLQGLGRFAPPPRAQDSNLRKVEAANRA